MYQAGGRQYYAVLDKGMKGFIMVGIDLDPNGNIGKYFIGSETVAPLPEKYTFSSARSGDIMVFATNSMLYITYNGQEAVYTFDVEPKPKNPRIVILQSADKTEIRVFDENWKNMCLSIKIGKEIETLFSELSAK